MTSCYRSNWASYWLYWEVCINTYCVIPKITRTNRLTNSLVPKCTKPVDNYNAKDKDT